VITRKRGGRKDFIYGGGGKAGQWYAKRATKAGVRVKEGDVITGGLGVERLREDRKHELEVK